MQHLGEKWLYVFSIIQSGNFTYNGTSLRIEDEIFFDMDELEGAINKLDELKVSPETDQSSLDALECLNFIKEKIGG